MTIKSKAIKFNVSNVNHPDGKLSKSQYAKDEDGNVINDADGNPTFAVLKVTHYEHNGTTYSTSDVITLDKHHRFLTARDGNDDPVDGALTDAEIKEVKGLKGDAVLRAIMLKSHALAKKICNTAKNTGVILDPDKAKATNDFIATQVSEALDRLLKKEVDDAITLPF